MATPSFLHQVLCTRCCSRQVRSAVNRTSVILVLEGFPLQWGKIGKNNISQFYLVLDGDECHRGKSKQGQRKEGVGRGKWNFNEGGHGRPHREGDI